MKIVQCQEFLNYATFQSSLDPLTTRIFCAMCFFVHVKTCFSSMMNVFQDITHLQHVNDESCTQGSSSEQPARNDSLRPMFGASDELSLFSPCGVGAHSSSFVQASKNTSKKLVSSNAVQPPTFPLQPEWIYSRGTLWDDFLSISLNSEVSLSVLRVFHVLVLVFMMKFI